MAIIHNPTSVSKSIIEALVATKIKGRHELVPYPEKGLVRHEGDRNDQRDLVRFKIVHEKTTPDQNATIEVEKVVMDHPDFLRFCKELQAMYGEDVDIVPM